jgi:MFS family permease
VNLWATLIGAAFCFPAGWIFDRAGLRWATAGIVLALAGVVCGVALMGSSMGVLFVLLTATRGLGQSALSVASITAVGRRFPERTGMPMAVFAVLISVLFAVAFGLIGYAVRTVGWRAAWLLVAMAMAVLIAPLVLIFLRGNGGAAASATASDGMGLWEALRTPAFWVFAGAAAAFNFVSSGFGLFNEAILAERGFEQKTFHIFLGVTTLLSLVGQFLGGWLSGRIGYRAVTAIAMAVYAVGLGGVSMASSLAGLMGISLLIGIAGGMIIVVFFAVWAEAFGRRNLGRIQGAAQFMTVVSSALGPTLFALCFESQKSYTPILLAMAGLVFVIGFMAIRVRMPSAEWSGRQDAVAV